MITQAQLTGALPHAQKKNIEAHYLFLVDAMTKYEINTPMRQCHFLAQAAHETGLFSKMVENMNYSAERLMVVFPVKFPSMEFAKQYDHLPVKIGNYVYGYRNGNGDSDGYKYRGRGMFHYTFKSSYTMLSKVFGKDFVNNPDTLSEEPWASLSAGYYWKLNRLNDLADKDNIRAITVAINGGLNGFYERLELLAALKKEMGI